MIQTKIKNWIGGALLFGALGAAPVLPVGNGLISVAVFEDSTTGATVVVQQADEQYRKMGGAGGIQHNPTLEGAEWKYSFQYPANFKQPSPIPSATSTPEFAVLEAVQSFDDRDTVSLFEYLTPKAEAAIAFDAAIGAHTVGAAATSLTYAKTNTGSNLYLVVGVQTVTLSEISSVTYNGVAMTSVAEESVSSSDNRLYGLAGPATGANNVVVTLSASREFRSWAGSYTGVNQASPIDNTGSATNDAENTSMTLTITSVADNAWMITSGGAQRNPSAGAGTTFRSNSGSEAAYRLFDANGPKTPAGAITLEITYALCGANCQSMVGATLAPAADAPVSVGEMILYDE